MFLMDDLECVCPAEVSQHSNEYRPYTHASFTAWDYSKDDNDRRRNLWWWREREATTFIDPNGCVCNIPPELDENLFNRPNCTCDVLPPSVLSLMPGVLPLGFDNDFQSCVCHEQEL
jgi:hypothetical protein